MTHLRLWKIYRKPWSLHVFTFQNAGVLSIPSFYKSVGWLLHHQLRLWFLSCSRSCNKSDQHWILIHLLQLNLAISLIQQLKHSGKESQSFPPGAPAEENITHRAASGCPNGGPDAQPAIADLMRGPIHCVFCGGVQKYFYTRDYHGLSIFK